MIFVFWLIMGSLVAWIASKKGHSVVGWFIYGALLWPIALIHIALASNKGQGCPKCFSNIDSRATVCPFCKHKITADELKVRNEARDKGQNTKFIVIAVMAGFFFIFYSIIGSSVKRQTDLVEKVAQDLNNKTSSTQPSSKVPYSVKLSGSLSYIILDSKYVNKEDLATLEKELKSDYKNTGFIRISIYNDIKAVEMRDRVINETSTKSEAAFYDAHYIAQYNKNSNTSYEEFALMSKVPEKK